MALPSTMHRFQIELSDTERGVYETLALRVARHPSETLGYMLARVFARLLHAADDVELSAAGLCVPDEPALSARAMTGGITLWIDVGQPSAERLHKASKAAERVMVYMYRCPKTYLNSLKGQRIHAAETLEFVALAPDFMEALSATVARRNDWSVVRSGAELYVTVEGQTFTGSFHTHTLPS